MPDSPAVKKLELVNLYYLDSATGQWRGLYAATGEGPAVSFADGTNNSILIYDNASGFYLEGLPPITAGHKWTNFFAVIGAETSDLWTIFSDTITGLLPEDSVSVKIRYQLRLTDNSQTPVVITPPTLYYQIVNAAYPADHISVTGTASTGPCYPVATIDLPGISNSMVANAAELFGWITNPLNWQVSHTAPSGRTRVIGVSNITLNLSDSSIEEFEGAQARLTLYINSMNIVLNGTHTLTFSLLPNSQDTNGFHVFADTHTWTANVTILTPSLTERLYYAFDSTVFMEFNFTNSAPPEP